MDIKILVATHKQYRMPDDDMYLPIHVGKALTDADFGYIGDDTGENISVVNKNFCELTAVYWAWKNLEADYIGLVHYRRHFTCNKRKDKFSSILNSTEAMVLCEKYDIIVPNKRKYYIETIHSHWCHLPYGHEDDLNVLGQVIQTKCPEYLQGFNDVMNRTWAHMFNMFIMEKSYFHEYCAWLFDILFEVDRKIDISDYPPMDARAVAFLGEFMLDIWLEKNRLPYHETKVIFMEKQNWLKKGGLFLLRKLKGMVLRK